MKIDATINVDSAVSALERVEKVALDQTAAMREIAEKMGQRVRDTFRLQEDPWGVAWQEHAASTIWGRMGRGDYNAQILFQSGELYRSIGQDWDSNSATVTAGEGDSAAYAGVHQFGKKAGRGSGFTMPKRSFMPLESEEQAVLPDEWWEDAVAPLNRLLEEAAG